MPAIDIIDELLLWIDENIENKLSIKCISARSGYSAWYIQRAFKASKGISLGRFVKHRRLSKAAEEIRSTDCAIFHIYLKYNYESYSCFSRAFKSLFNMSPREYRMHSVDSGFFNDH